MRHSFCFAQKTWLMASLAILLLPSGLAGAAQAQYVQTDSWRPQLVRRNGSTAFMVNGQWKPGRRLNGDEASWRVRLGYKPQVLIARAYRY